MTNMPAHFNPSLTSKAESNEEEQILRPLNDLHSVIRTMYHKVQNHQETSVFLESWDPTINPST